MGRIERGEDRTAATMARRQFMTVAAVTGIAAPLVGVRVFGQEEPPAEDLAYAEHLERCWQDVEAHGGSQVSVWGAFTCTNVCSWYGLCDPGGGVPEANAALRDGQFPALPQAYTAHFPVEELGRAQVSLRQTGMYKGVTLTSLVGASADPLPPKRGGRGGGPAPNVTGSACDPHVLAERCAAARRALSQYDSVLISLGGISAIYNYFSNQVRGWSGSNPAIARFGPYFALAAGVSSGLFATLAYERYIMQARVDGICGAQCA